MSNFRVGQQVVCVDAGPQMETGAPSPFSLRGVYEIEAIAPPRERIKCPFCGKMMAVSDACAAIALLNIDVCGPVNGQHYCRYWTIARFRPVQYDTTKAVEAIKASLPKLKSREKVEP